MRSIQSLTRRRRGELKRFLARPGHPKGTLSYHEAQGFFFVLAWAPALVPPSDWISRIFGGGEPLLESSEDSAKMLGNLMALYNESALGDRITAPRLPRDCTFRDDVMANLEPDAPISQWSRGFATGHVWLEEGWDSSAREGWDEQLNAVVTTLSFFCSRSVAESLAESSTKPDTTVERLAGSFRDVFSDAMAAYADMSEALANPFSQSREEEAAPAPPGRNAPCPCGSGRKYKKCCGAHVH